jgi:hypothetical protein
MNMKIIKKIIQIIFSIVVLLLIQNLELLEALERDMKYEPSKEYLKKVSLTQETRYCVEICYECVEQTNVLKVITKY